MLEKILLSTDIGSDIDDALALLTIFNSKINLDGIYTVNGNVIARSYISKHLVDLAEKKIEVGIGEAKPLEGGIKPYTYFEEYYVDKKFIDKEKTKFSKEIIFKSPQEVGIKDNGLKRMAEKLTKSPKIIFSIGPMTNIAKLIIKYPETIKNIKRLYIMGCRFSKENTLEHNVRFDIPAAKTIFEADIPTTVIPGDLCSRYRMPIKQLYKLESKAGKYVKKMAMSFLAIKTIEEIKRSGIEDLLKKYAKLDSNYIKNELNKKKLIKNYEKLDKLIMNLDDYFYGIFNPKEYFNQYHELISHLKNPKLNYSRGNIFANILETTITKDISIADVYVPYCFLYPEKIKIEKANISINPFGYSRKKKGNKNSIVTNLDFQDFKKFLSKYLK